MGIQDTKAGPKGYPKKYLLWIGYVLLFLFASVSIFIVTGHVILIRIWHWRHGNTAIFHQFAVPVPRDYRAFYGKDGGLIIQRLPPLFRSEDPPSIIVAEFQWPSDRTYDAPAWRRIRIETISAHGYRYHDTDEFYVGEDMAYCLQFKGIQDSTNFRGVCDIPSAHLSVDFMGPSYGWFDFYPIVRDIKPRSK